MKEITKNKKNVIAGKRLSRESLYYSILFGMGAVAAAVLLYLGITKHNKGLIIYSGILIPVFLIGTLIAVRFVLVSKNTVYSTDEVLVVKAFFITRKFKVAEIEKLTAAQSGVDGITSVNITYRGKTAHYRFKDLTKDDVSSLRRATSVK